MLKRENKVQQRYSNLIFKDQWFAFCKLENKAGKNAGKQTPCTEIFALCVEIVVLMRPRMHGIVVCHEIKQGLQMNFPKQGLSCKNIYENKVSVIEPCFHVSESLWLKLVFYLVL